MKTATALDSYLKGRATVLVPPFPKPAKPDYCPYGPVSGNGVVGNASPSQWASLIQWRASRGLALGIALGIAAMAISPSPAYASPIAKAHTHRTHTHTPHPHKPRH
jgi:hypothetical protein